MAMATAGAGMTGAAATAVDVGVVGVDAAAGLAWEAAGRRAEDTGTGKRRAVAGGEAAGAAVEASRPLETRAAAGRRGRGAVQRAASVGVAAARRAAVGSSTAGMAAAIWATLRGFA